MGGDYLPYHGWEVRSIIFSRTPEWEWTTLRRVSGWESSLVSLDPRVGVGELLIMAPVDESEVIFTPMQAHSLVLLTIDCSFSHLMALRTPSGLQAPDSRDEILPHA